jgi:hypothetical protein
VPVEVGPLTAAGLLFLVSAAIAKLVSTRRAPRCGPLICLFIYNTFYGYLNNLYGRPAALHASRFVILAGVGVHWLWIRARAGGVREIPSSTMDRPLSLFFCYYTLQMLNPNWSSFQVGLLNGVVGMASHGLPMLLFFVARDCVRTSRQGILLLRLLVLLSTVMALYGLYQFHRGYGYVADLSEGFHATIRREAYHPDEPGAPPTLRAVSFAPDAGTASAYYMAGILIAAGLLLDPAVSGRHRLVLLATVLVQFYVLAITLVRATMLGTLLGLSYIAWASRRFLRITLPLGLLLYVALSWSDRTILPGSERYTQLADPGHVVKARGRQVEAIGWAARNFPGGMGIGRAGPAGGRFNATQDDRYNFPPESYFVSIIFETGVLGLLFVVAIFGIVGRSALLAPRAIRQTTLHAPAIAAAAVVVPIMAISVAGPTLYASPFSYLFWFLSGVLFQLQWVQARMQSEDDRPDPGSRSPGAAPAGRRPEAAGELSGPASGQPFR